MSKGSHKIKVLSPAMRAKLAGRPCRCTQVIGGGLNLWYLDPNTGRYSDGPYPGSIPVCRKCYEAISDQSKRKKRVVPGFLRQSRQG